MRKDSLIVFLALTLSMHAAEEIADIITIEAESFARQTLNDKRRWHITSATSTPDIVPDGDPPHVEGASGGSYVELLPDTRRSHDDKLINGENFTNKGGQMAMLSYPVKINTPGRYYIWVRAYSTTSEDNGLHFGLNGEWPESGARWQTVQKNGWNWDCKQRTEEVHVGVPMQLWLDIDKAGDHELLMSMREDGIEVDQIILAKSVDFRPTGAEVEQPAAAEAKVPVVPVVMPRLPDGKGGVTINGELKQWHKVSLALDGPYAHEQDNAPNPFTDLAFNVTFTHESGAPKYVVPGYFAADSEAAHSCETSGTTWLAHLSPDKTGTWNYRVSFARGKHAALDGGGEALKPFDGQTGSFQIAASDKTGRDFRAHGRLQYVGGHHLQFAGSKEYFLKAGADAPETMLGYADFDNTQAGKPDKVPLKTWQPHLQDWRHGDPIWQGGKGKGLIGALNYLASKGVNAFSFLTYNAAGDGDNVWPFIQREDKLHYDCSKLGQWGIVFDHATQLGLYLHFKLQENESDDERLGPARKKVRLPEALDGGRLDVERKLYCRELIARFGHALALNWNIGEENTQTSDEVREMVKFIHDTDPYRHPIVLHTFPPEQEKVYRPLLGGQSLLSGVSLQNSWKAAHQQTLLWVRESAAAGRPWVVANDEQNPAGLGVPPDPGYKGHDGVAVEKTKPKGTKAEGNFQAAPYTLHDIRKLCLWGTLMAGGAGVEYYFGYALPENDLVCEDFRSRDKSWDFCRIALDFFRDEKIPFQEMSSADALVGNDKHDNSLYCLARAGDTYLVYLPEGGGAELDLGGAAGGFTVSWFNPRSGGSLQSGSVENVSGGGKVSLGAAPSDEGEDWLVVIRR